VDEIKSLLKSILKGKTKEVDPGDLIIDWSKPPKAAGRDTIEYGKAGPSSPKQGRKAGLSLPYGRAGPSSSKSHERAGPKRSHELVIPPKKSKKKLAHRSRSVSRSSRSESESSDRSGRSSSSSSSSPSPSPSPFRSPSPSPTGQIFIRFDDMNRDLRNALRVSILFVYLPNCILTIFIYD
jgi:hypothetical protein